MLLRRTATRLASISSQIRPQTSCGMFDLSPIPSNPLGGERHIQTAACLIIGDEILNGKTMDKNSNYLAKALFRYGIQLKRTEVIADDEEEIIEAARRMVKNYDLVVTSGGIGPTHDDITYQSLAKAFDKEGKLEYHEETMSRMATYFKGRAPLSEDQELARRRMALFPVYNTEVLFVNNDKWVPVVRLEGKLCILPGVPGIFRDLLDGLLASFLPLPPASQRPLRMLIATSMSESSIAPFLSSLQVRVKDDDITIGSYPKYKQVDVSLIGRDHEKIRSIAQEVANELNGKIVQENIEEQ